MNDVVLLNDIAKRTWIRQLKWYVPCTERYKDANVSLLDDWKLFLFGINHAIDFMNSFRKYNCRVDVSAATKNKKKRRK